MKRLVFVLLLWNGTILQGQQTGGAVLVAEPIMRFVRRPDLAVRCNAAMEVHACTAFVGQRLWCECSESGGQWQLDVKAQFIPVMYVTGAAYVVHERQHIGDIERSLRRYLVSLQSLRFESEEVCRRAAGWQVERFTRTMDQFKIESNALRHPDAPRKIARR